MTLKHHWGYMYISPFVCANAATAIFSQALPAGRPGERYIQRLKEEIGLFEPEENCRAESVFFGGGTPSLLEGGGACGADGKNKGGISPQKSGLGSDGGMQPRDGDRG